MTGHKHACSRQTEASTLTMCTQFQVTSKSKPWTAAIAMCAASLAAFRWILPDAPHSPHLGLLPTLCRDTSIWEALLRRHIVSGTAAGNYPVYNASERPFSPRRRYRCRNYNPARFMIADQRRQLRGCADPRAPCETTSKALLMPATGDRGILQKSLAPDVENRRRAPTHS